MLFVKSIVKKEWKAWNGLTRADEILKIIFVCKIEKKSLFKLLSSTRLKREIYDTILHRYDTIRVE